MPAIDGEPDGDEEVCARERDAFPADTLRYWVRNVAQHPGAFWLPLAGGWFCPDFIAELADGKMMVAEYKGEHIVSSDDTKEKVAVGLLWERAMGDGRWATRGCSC